MKGEKTDDKNNENSSKKD